MKLQKKEMNWFMEQFDIHQNDYLQMCRQGYENKSWKKKRHHKKEG